MVTLSEIQEAAARLQPYINRTPLLRAPALDAHCGCTVYLKPENLQITGSFKLRGATNKLLALSKAERERGVIAASSGNHGQGVACAAARLGVNAVIVMPENAPPAKIGGAKQFGATVLLHGLLSSERNRYVERLAEEQGRVIIHPYNDPEVTAGQGTAALEILADLPELDLLVSPIGGGGLINGLSTAAKALQPTIRVAGVEPQGAPRYSQSRAAGQPLAINMTGTIADGTRTNTASAYNFPVIEQNVDELASVSDAEIKAAIYAYAKLAKLVVEPSAAMPLAALLAGRLPCQTSDKVCLMISGGNLDLWQYGEWLREGESELAKLA